MLKKVKNFKNVTLNNQDVLVLNTLLKKGTNIFLPDDASKALQEQAGKEYLSKIIAIGKEVTCFDVDDIVVAFKTDQIPEWQLDPTNEDSDGISVTHMNNILMTTKPDNYELS